jgi:chromosome segregation ATPase
MKTKVKEQEEVITPYSPGEAAKQIAAKAQSEIAILRERIDELQATSQALQFERSELLTEQAQRQDHLANLRQIVNQLERKHKEAVAYASVAVGTVGEHASVVQLVEAEDELKATRATLQTTEHEYDELNAAATIRLAQIDSELDSHTRESDSCHDRLEDVKHVAARSMKELGEHTYTGITQEYSQHTASIDRLRQAITEAEIHKHKFLEQAKEKLISWPDLLQQIAREQPYDDPMVRAIDSCTQYLETLQRDGDKVLKGTSFAGHVMYQDWRNLLGISANEIIAEYQDVSKTNLTHHIEDLKAMRDWYMSTKR